MTPTIRSSRFSARRKACDECCRRKIKCDAKQPVCSGCSLHQTACEWTPGTAAKKPKTPQPVSLDVNQSLRAIEDRLAFLESRLGRQDDGPANIDPSRPNTNVAFPESPASLPDRTVVASAGGEMCPSDVQDAAYPLPSYQDVFVLITQYFAGFNAGFPLFHPQTTEDMISDWYNLPTQRDQATWAVINVIIALALRHDASSSVANAKSLASTCMDRAQSVMTTLVYRDQDLKGMQVLIGLAMLFLSTPHPQPACVFIASAVKLAHRLKLHIERSYEGLDPIEASQRRCVFWLTYMLDREISVLTMEPYLLQDHDIDVTRPSESPCSEDVTGTLSYQEGEERVRYFALRVHLAYVQGKVYDLTYSVRALALSSTHKQAAVERLFTMLSEWQAQVPAGFNPSAVAASKNTRKFAILLSGAYAQSLFIAHRAHARDDEWVQGLLAYDHEQSSRTRRERQLKETVFSLPSKWIALAGMARFVLQMHSGIHPDDEGLLWRLACANHAAIVILAASNLTVGEHGCQHHLDEDALRVAEAIEQLGVQMNGKEDTILKEVHATCVQLRNKAALAVRKFRQDEGELSALWGTTPLGI